jgi:hypothetical protein
MVDRFRLTAAVDAQLVRDPGEVDEVFAHRGARLAGLAERVGTGDVVAFAAGHRGGEAVLTRELLEVQLAQFRLGVERVEVAGCALHEEENARPGPGGVVRSGFAVSGGFFREQCVERRQAQPSAQAVEYVTPRPSRQECCTHRATPQPLS